MSDIRSWRFDGTTVYAVPSLALDFCQAFLHKFHACDKLYLRPSWLPSASVGVLHFSSHMAWLIRMRQACDLVAQDFQAAKRPPPARSIKKRELDMTIVKWDERLSMGHDIIDRQHKNLIGIIGQLHESLLEPSVEDHTKLIILQLYRYATYHFGEEESLMRSALYKESESHQEQHNEFIKKLDTLSIKSKAGDTSTVTELLSMLVAWLVHHISVEDRKLAACLKVHSV